MNFGGTEVMLIVLVILLLFGPSQIPKMARGFGQTIREFKKAQREIGDELEHDAHASTKNKDKSSAE
ncbi:MAG: twin-arginine translocase TatA/TatE family subunit [bacterium]